MTRLECQSPSQVNYSLTSEAVHPFHSAWMEFHILFHALCANGSAFYSFISNLTWRWPTQGIMLSIMCMRVRMCVCARAVAETWRRVFGGRKIFSRTKTFWIAVFGEKNLFSRPKFLMTFFIFFSSRPGFSDFPFLFPDSAYLYYVKCRRLYDPFLTRKNTISEKNFFTRLFFNLFVLPRASDNTTSQNIGEDRCMAHPHLIFWGDRCPQSL